jgi:hypothetical protein
MAQPVWILSVDLQAKTATFQTGMSDAARSARGAFNDIGSGAEGMGRRMGRGMTEARHSVMMLGEEFGVHIPRALATFIASLGPVGATLEAAFPFLAIIVGATLLIEHLEKLHAAGMKLTADQMNLGTAANNAFNTLEQKLMQAQIKSDELRNDHMGALKLQLELIDQQSFAELVHSFDELQKVADTVFKDLEGHWYTFGIGSDGAKAMLDDFKSKYNNLLSQNTDAGRDQAHNLLAGTLKTAQDVLKAQQTIKANRDGGDGQTDESYAAERTLKAHQASLTVTHDEIAAQEAVVTALQRQVQLEGVAAQQRKTEGNNAKTEVGNEAAARRSAAAKQAAESQLRMGEQSIAADRAQADATLSIHRASLEQRLASDIDFAGRDRDLKQAANVAEIAALDKSNKDYANQLKALNEKALEITSEYDTKVAELKAKSSVDVNSRELRDLEQSEREKIEATQQGSSSRLAAINAALKEEESLGLQDTASYRELLNQRVQAARQEAEEEGRLKAEAAREEADNDEKMGQLTISAEKQRMALEDSARRVTVEQRIAEDTRIANEEYALKVAALDKEAQGLDKSGKDYQNKLKQLQDKEKQLTQQHANEMAAIKDKAAEGSNQRILSSYQQFANATSQSLTQSIMGHQTWARMIQSLGDQVVSGMLANAIKSAMLLDFDKEKQAGEAARWGFVSGMKLPFPANVIAAPVMAAGAFAAVMAFEGGTDCVPGVGRGDIVPTMTTPGEGIVPGGVMDGLRNMARSGGFERGPTISVRAHFAPTIHALDADGVDAVLEKHADKFQRHFENTLRRMNH